MYFPHFALDILLQMKDLKHFKKGLFGWKLI